MDYSHLRFALFGNVYQTKKNQFVAAILQKLSDLHVNVLIESDFADFLEHQLAVRVSDYKLFGANETFAADAAISIGGDGTFLGTAAKVGTAGIPILGINTGRLGFLADVSPEAIGPSLEALCQGDYVVEKRKVLQVSHNMGADNFYPFALNEVAVLKHDNSSLIEIATYVDNNYLTTYLADGLIVTTPTGSTGYSLSVGGPILTPQSGTFCLAPVAPHSLSVRPVVVRDEVEIRLHIRSRSHNFLLSADGRSQSLPETAIITIHRAAHTVKVIKIEHTHFFDTLRDKMMWGADQRN
ncbi:MAG: NAD kinase [Alloprevotella sp.]